MDNYPVPWRIVHALAPIRICDLGGWTDTWFAEHGKVFNIGVHPGVEVRINVHPAGALPGRVVLDVKNYGDRYASSARCSRRARTASASVARAPRVSSQPMHASVMETP